MLQVRCPNCDAPTTTQADAPGMVECARCGRIFDAEVRPKMAAETAGAERAPEFDVPAPALPGRQLFRVVQRLTKRPSVIRLTKSARPAGGPQPRPAGKWGRRRPFGRIRPELRRMFFAAVVFVGVPAALIFFVIVVCAPKEDALARRPVRAERPQPAKSNRHSWLGKLRP